MNFSIHSSSLYTSRNDNHRLEQVTSPSINDQISAFDDKNLFPIDNHSQDLTNSQSDLLLDFFDEIQNQSKKKTSYHCCSKKFISDFGLNRHTNMYHPNQSIICSDCQMTFRSHRTLKSHQQRSHSSPIPTNPDYNYISSYLVVAFSSFQFPVMCETACVEKRLPLGELSSKFFPCPICRLSFPCSRALNYHNLTKHQTADDRICKRILDQLIDRISLETNYHSDEMESIQIALAQQASQFGLIRKDVAREERQRTLLRNEQVYPRCSHTGRTCANLCLKFLPSFDQLIRTHTFQIPLVPKGNPFNQGSIISKLPRRLSTNEISSPKELVNGSPRRKAMKRANSSMSDITSLTPVKKKSLSNKPQSIQSTTKIHEPKSNGSSRSSTTATTVVTSRKTSSKTNHMHTRSLSSNNLLSKTNTSSPRSSKRSRSPTITLAVERASQKRRQRREQSKIDRSPIRIKLDDDIEQENDDDDIIVCRSDKPKQRQASSGSVEYIHVLNNDNDPAPSLNNIENLKTNIKLNNSETLIHDSPASPKKLSGSSTKRTTSKTDVTANKNSQYQATDDEHIRVRCKVCGEILEGRSLFSKHVLTMHSHLLNKSITNRQQQTATVR